jgi:hypothetical protein
MMFEPAAIDPNHLMRIASMAILVFALVVPGIVLFDSERHRRARLTPEQRHAEDREMDREW